MSWEGPVIKAGINVIIDALTAIGKKGQAGKQKAALSTVIAELLRIDPDITTAEAQLLAAEAVGAKPTPELLRARDMLKAAKRYKRKKRRPGPRRGKKKTTKRKATKRKATKRKAAKK